jgi:hypothetical protein
VVMVTLELKKEADGGAVTLGRWGADFGGME